VQAVEWAGRLAPIIISLTIFALLFRLVPARDTHLRDTWPGVVVASAGFEAAKAGFSVYLENFSRYDAIYASLGSVIAFLVFVWVAANVLLLGAEVASEYPRLGSRIWRTTPRCASGSPAGCDGWSSAARRRRRSRARTAATRRARCGPAVPGGAAGGRPSAARPRHRRRPATAPVVCVVRT
jgi:hypothetical protein